MTDKSQTCPNLAGCRFFNELNLPATGGVLKELYCYGEHVKCMRYTKMAKGENVPDELWPDGRTMKTTNRKK